MYPWRLWIAVIMGTLWYFSEYGQIATQFVLCVLCCYLSTPPILRNMGQESGTQTDEAAQEDEHRVMYIFAHGRLTLAMIYRPLQEYAMSTMKKCCIVIKYITVTRPVYLDEEPNH